MGLRDLISGEKFRKTIEKTTLIKLVLVFSGHKLADIGEVKE